MKKFPILKIPDVVFREVISMMTPNEIVKLSMSDFKIELLLRNRKYKLRAIHLQLGNITSRIDMNTTNDCPVVMFQKIDNNKRKPITQLVQLRDRFQKEIDEDLCLTYVSLDEMFSIYSNLNQLFSSREINWILRFDELKLEEFLEYVDRILTTEFYRFKVVGGSMSNDLLRGLMEKVPEKATIVIESDIPSDYSHAKALKFRSFKYREARWLKIEDLFCIRKSYIVKLDITNFDSSDVNRFLNYWSDCDKDMMKEIIITLKEGAQINQQEILKNLIVISDNDGDFQFFIKARNMGHRQFVVGDLKFRERKVIFTVRDPFRENFLYEYLVLKLVHQIRDCEEIVKSRSSEARDFQLELEELERKLAVLNRDYVVFSYH